jgi:hypothetical protein
MLLPREFHIFYTVVLLAIAFGSGLLSALVLNSVLKTPLHRYLISSGLIVVISFWVTGIIGNFTFPPGRWVNGEPQDLRTALWDHLEIIAALAALICFATWQFAVRRRRRLREGGWVDGSSI